MNQYYLELKSMILAEDTIKGNCLRLYTHYGKAAIKEHVIRVSKKAIEIAHGVGLDTGAFETAAYLHDISGVIDRKHYLAIVEAEGIDVLEEERIFPMLLHQKISRNIAEKLFDIRNSEVLNAIECHTTLRPASSIFDKILFLSDKLEWDQKHRPLYFESVEESLHQSIDAALKTYLEYRMNNREDMLILHPWLKATCEEILV